MALLLGVSVLLATATPAAAEKGDGTAKYKYVVTANSEYTGSGQLSATRETTTCAPGSTAYWMGGVTSEEPGLGDLTPGKGSLKIGHNGTSGRIDAFIDEIFTFDAQHTLVVGCTLGAPSATQGTPCSTKLEGKAAVHGRIKGGAGDRVKIEWSIYAPGDGNPNSLVPDTFRCVDRFVFPPYSKCKSKANLDTLTRKTFKLPFECHGEELTAEPPLDTYSAFSDGFGFIALKRKKPG